MGNDTADSRVPGGGEPIGERERRVMNSRGRELLLRHWDFPLFASLLRLHGISLESTAILDAGCGSGYGLTLIWERFRPSRLVGFDILPSQVELARKRNVPATVFTGDIAAVQLPSRSCDAVFVCGVLHHCRTWRTGLAEVARVLKDGGVLLLAEPDSLLMRMERALSGHSPALEAGFSHQALRSEMPRAGLAIIEQRALYFGLFACFLCVKATSEASAEYVIARHLLHAPSESEFAAGQQVPA